MKSFEDLVGKLFLKVDVSNNNGDDRITIYSNEGFIYEMYHEQDCCESVYIKDICGDLDDLIGSPILVAEEVSQNDDEASESGTWTFYKLATEKGWVTITWYGESNGYYSESVDVYEKYDIQLARELKLKGLLE
jgi:hypothetical protein